MSLKKATRGAVDEITLMSLAVQANNFKVPIENLASFFEFATIRAAQTGESVEYLTRSIVTGIGRKSPLILDNLGITLVRLKEAMGKVGRESATVADISAAVGKIAKEETSLLKKLGMATETTAQKMDRLGAAYKNFKASVGQDAAEGGFFSSFISSMTRLGESWNINTQIEDVRKQLGLTKGETKDLRKELSKGLGLRYDEQKVLLLDEMLGRIGERLKDAQVGVALEFGAPSQLKTAKEVDEWADSTADALEEQRKTLQYIMDMDEDRFHMMQRSVKIMADAQIEALNKPAKIKEALDNKQLAFMTKYTDGLRKIAGRQVEGVIDVNQALKEQKTLIDALLTEGAQDSELGASAAMDALRDATIGVNGELAKGLMLSLTKRCWTT